VGVSVPAALEHGCGEPATAGSVGEGVPPGVAVAAGLGLGLGLGQGAGVSVAVKRMLRSTVSATCSRVVNCAVPLAT
jgi:hypothetical protein